MACISRQKSVTSPLLTLVQLSKATDVRQCHRYLQEDTHTCQPTLIYTYNWDATHIHSHTWQATLIHKHTCPATFIKPHWKTSKLLRLAT